jgi:hypothetical protein
VTCKKGGWKQRALPWKKNEPAGGPAAKRESRKTSTPGQYKERMLLFSDITKI